MSDVTTRLNLLDYGSGNSNSSDMDHVEEHSKFGRGEANLYTLIIVHIVDKLHEAFDIDDNERIYRCAHALGAILTDRETFINRTTNYELFCLATIRSNDRN